MKISGSTPWITTMKISKTNALLIWKQLEDVLVPRLGLTLSERAVYSHLLRHSRLEDRLRLRFSILWLCRGQPPVCRVGAPGGAAPGGQGGSAPGRTHESRPRRRGPFARGDSRSPLRKNRPRWPGAAAPHGQPRGDGFPANEGAARGHSCARTQPVLLLFAAADGPRALPRSCRAASPEGQQFVPPPGFLLRRMQRTERRNLGGGLSALALPRRAYDGRRIHWAAAGGRSACGGQAAARTEQRGRKGPEAQCSFKITFAGTYVLGALELRGHGCGGGGGVIDGPCPRLVN